MTENDYQLAWGIYAISALGCLLVWFYFTSWMWRYLREPLRVIAAVMLFTPTVVDPARDFYAPAIAITVMRFLRLSVCKLRCARRFGTALLLF